MYFRYCFRLTFEQRQWCRYKTFGWLLTVWWLPRRRYESAAVGWRIFGYQGFINFPILGYSMT